MALPKHYRIDYLLNGSFKSFYIRADNMDNAEAWHYASVDAGLARIPKYRLEKVPRVTKPHAENFGITNVEWVKT
ncbi:hypothetical protein K5D56_00085 [Pseudomonas cichorii]|uniref:Uncharacterized protein n=1 Tax=Pseudomonas lijiangensis TaxID=2995658 RepID=A0ABX8HZ99_9PSED|nr:MULTISPECIES: DUF6555 family protein [Pseudomonas syringae group]MBX8492816.1 hypothetical protein [Pseudomonas cichorii]MBX8501828.1 hypothetical protein [Pseudomonas lijiangensis]MBX8506663.1 hypothetical protein [Pseudomonas lijiangensis]MBX8518541.1 hypothetical protein [Pseudomonas cichorii]MBX8550331.1 hypothetical protein [Pseudomonas cichorii]